MISSSVDKQYIIIIQNKINEIIKHNKYNNNAVYKRVILIDI
jgi:hypothetical protein